MRRFEADNQFVQDGIGYLAQIHRYVEGPWNIGANILLEKGDRSIRVTRWGSVHTEEGSNVQRTSLSIEVQRHPVFALTVETKNGQVQDHFLNFSFVLPEKVVEANDIYKTLGRGRIGRDSMVVTYGCSSREFFSMPAVASAPNELGVDPVQKRQELETLGMSRGYFEPFRSPRVDYAASVDAFFGLVDGYLARPETLEEWTIPVPLVLAAPADIVG